MAANFESNVMRCLSFRFLDLIDIVNRGVRYVGDTSIDPLDPLCDRLLWWRPKA